MTPPRRFFFYGTLIAGHANAAARTSHRKLRALGPARTRGSLWAIREEGCWYPALVPGKGWVHGMLYLATSAFAAGDLTMLDGWEDCRPAAKDQSLYWREPAIVIEGQAKRSRAELYVYNGKLPSSARPIPAGDFSAWLAHRGYRAFGE